MQWSQDILLPRCLELSQVTSGSSALSCLGERSGCMTLGGCFLAPGSSTGFVGCPQTVVTCPQGPPWYRPWHVLVCHPRGCCPAFQGRLGLLQHHSPSSGCCLQRCRELYTFSFCKLSKTWFILLKPRSPALQADSFQSEPPGKPKC